MNQPQSRSSSLNDAALDALFAGSGERLLAAYLRNALHTISPGVAAFWAEVIASAIDAEAATFAEDPELDRQYASLLEALQVDAASLREMLRPR